MRHTDELAWMAHHLRAAAERARGSWADAPTPPAPPCWCGVVHCVPLDHRRMEVLGEKWTGRGWAEYGTNPAYSWVLRAGVDAFERALRAEAPALWAAVESDALVARAALR